MAATRCTIVQMSRRITRRSFLEGAASTLFSLPFLAWSPKALGGMVPFAFFKRSSASNSLYSDDVFSTDLYIGNSSAQTITNGIDLLGQGGLVWIKMRTGGGSGIHILYDSARGFATDKAGTISSTGTFTLNPSGLSSVSSTGFNLGSHNYVNTSSMFGGEAGPQKYVSWTFRKAAKFFDVLTYTGDGVAGRQIPHSLGMVPGMILVKRTDSTQDWSVWHRSADAGNGPGNASLVLNTSAAANNNPAPFWTSGSLNVSHGATHFTVGSDASVNASGASYVAYLFAHDSGADGIIQCGGYAGDGTSSKLINLGWEAQFILVKAASGTTAASQHWCIYDQMRGMTAGAALNDRVLYANDAASETLVTGDIAPHANGFVLEGNDARVNSSANQYIYLAIRRSNKPPTSGTQVFSPVFYSGSGSAGKVVSYPGLASVDLIINSPLNTGSGTNNYKWWTDRLRSQIARTSTESIDGKWLASTSNATEASSQLASLYNMNQLCIQETNVLWNSNSFMSYGFRRARGVFDIVCYTGTGIAAAVNHSLGAVPELIIVKQRGNITDWQVYSQAIGNTRNLNLNSNSNSGIAAVWNNATPTATSFEVGTQNAVNGSGLYYVAYLFATKAGISKVGSYTGNDGSQNIDCGFSSGARFILIKRTDSTGDWFVWDTARGINLSGSNESHISLNSTAAEVTSDDSIDPYAAGFTVKQNVATSINMSGGTYLFLALA